ncbi:MAG: phosphatidylserine decarboxylase family protein [Thermodesulfobacteriota bacterium]|nr:phosphatidylserine decarboxylase family protein [Thermodesulfobacteriota bacterium]
MMPIRTEGSPFIIGVAIAATLITLFSILYPGIVLQILVVVSWILFILIINFFRDPERMTPFDVNTVIAPADGKIIDIRTVTEDRFIKGDVSRISIFMSIFDVHVNRAPLEGTIVYLDYKEGDFRAAYDEKASLANEQMSIGFLKKPVNGTPPGDDRVMIKLIAGYVARRIVFFKHLKEMVKQGERISMIKFGSRVEVFLPPEWEVLIKQGERVRAGETILARIPTGEK